MRLPQFRALNAANSLLLPSLRDFIEISEITTRGWYTTVCYVLFWAPVNKAVLGSLQQEEGVDKRNRCHGGDQLQKLRQISSFVVCVSWTTHDVLFAHKCAILLHVSGDGEFIPVTPDRELLNLKKWTQGKGRNVVKMGIMAVGAVFILFWGNFVN